MPKMNKIIAYTRVSADIFHYGHLRLLKNAKKISDYHICGLYDDDLCLKWNGNLIMHYNERLAVLEDLNCVDEVLKQDELDPTRNLKLINKRFPNSKIIFFQGHQSWKGLPGTNYVQSIGGQIVKPDYYSRITRKSIKNELNKIKRVKSHDIESYILGDISYFTLYNSTKANTLASLKPNLEKSLVEELFIFTKAQWEKSSGDVLKEIKNKFTNKIVVRSSSLIEDSHSLTYAGFFHSELNIDSQDLDEVKSAISKVIISYSKHDSNSQDDQILVQSQTQDVIYSGVVFTRNIQNNGPYYLINYDKSSLTDTVTSGQVSNKIEIVRNLKNDNLDPNWRSLIESVREIEGLLHNLALDIEFAINEKGHVIIFQVRPIAANQKYENIPDPDIFNVILDIKNRYKLQSKNSLLTSRYTLSDMAFWNPAEIIGDRSSNLAYSTYRYLILNRAWNEGLIPLGYKKVNRDLITRFGNKSYIEVETAFASLLPDELDDSISKKLITFYSEKLSREPELHDKIEFEIVHNCFTPTTDNQLLEVKSILNDEEYTNFRSCLINLTQDIFNNYKQIKSKDLESLDLLKEKRNQKVDQCKNATITEKINLVVQLFDDIRECGTPQFSRMARLAFIGNQFLKGLVSRGIITSDDSEKFLSNIDTVASELKRDFDHVISKSLSINEFNIRYGHLRPGTYDITKLPYAKDSEYFTIEKTNNTILESSTKKHNDHQNIEEKITSFFDTFEISISARQLLSFIEDTTKLREYFKFEFTKNLSISLELLVDVGEELGFDRQTLSQLSIESLKGISSSSGISEILDLWQSQIEDKRAKDKLYNYVALPALVFNSNDFEIIRSYTTRPNFITNLIIRGETINLDGIDSKNYNLVAGKIVLIEKADPGYDWIFSKGIHGLVTRFGGAASHMAIRCAEFGIAAAIGCGEVIYKEIKDRTIVELDCRNNKIDIIG
tara:strand:- start:4896 stop:7751 length:2856 start_codon:yes stop_codon:yes gene_type:complete